MARVPLIQEQDHPEFAEVIEKYRAGRRGKLLNIYRMLLNSPALAESWFNHSNAVRWQTSLDGRLREIAIIRMGHLTNSQYVLRQHLRCPILSNAVHAKIRVRPREPLLSWAIVYYYPGHAWTPRRTRGVTPGLPHMAKSLTAIAVEKARAGSVRREIPDGGCRGLYLVVQPSGVKSWALRYRS